VRYRAPVRTRTRARRAWPGLAGLALIACGEPAWVELQIADPALPFLRPSEDFDALLVEGRKSPCADVGVRYEARPLPASLTVRPGDCYSESIELRATALLGERPVARSGWRLARFDASPLVVTATLADVAGRRVLFETGFEAGEPFGDRTDALPLVRSRGVVELVARVDASEAPSGAAAVRLAGTASAADALVVVRVAATNLVLARDDELVFTLRLDGDAPVAPIGVELELSNGATAARLGLVDDRGRPLAPSVDGRAAGVQEQWRVPLGAAAGARLVGVLLALDLSAGGDVGRFGARLDDLALVRP
jgi:hypothetical protein